MPDANGKASANGVAKVEASLIRSATCKIVGRNERSAFEPLDRGPSIDGGGPWPVQLTFFSIAKKARKQQERKAGDEAKNISSASFAWC